MSKEQIADNCPFDILLPFVCYPFAIPSFLDSLKTLTQLICMNEVWIIEERGRTRTRLGGPGSENLRFKTRLTSETFMATSLYQPYQFPSEATTLTTLSSVHLRRFLWGSGATFDLYMHLVDALGGRKWFPVVNVITIKCVKGQQSNNTTKKSVYSKVPYR